MPHLVLLDLDKTVLTCNSANAWMAREWRLKKVSTFQFAEAMTWLAAYHLGKADVRNFLQHAGMWMAGELEADIQHRTETFWKEDISTKIRPSMREVIRWHQSNGDVLALLTASSNYLSELVAAELSIPHILSNRMEVIDGCLSGKMQEPLCFGDGKIVHAEMLGERLSMDWRAGYFYTDSYSDLPVLEAVANPIVVSPDQRLRRIALRNNWRIIAN